MLINEKQTDAKLIILSKDKKTSKLNEIYKLGAYHIFDVTDYINETELLIRANSAIQLKRQEEANLQLQIENIYLKKSIVQSHAFIGESDCVTQAKRQIMKLAQADEDMFVIGETGTGKEVAAYYYYLNSSRFAKPFHTVNCSALTETLIESELFGHIKGSFTSADRSKIGFFERCNNGVLFLDEITNLSLAAQSKILRAIENKEIQVVGGESQKVDTKLIFASNSSLEKLAQPDVFRKDLYYRIEGNIIELLPLRERGEDAYVLLNYFLSSYYQMNLNASRANLHKVKDMLLSYSWPGNVRELKNFCKAIVLSEKEITSDIIKKHLDLKIKKQNETSVSNVHKYIRMENLKAGVSNFERDFICYHLEKNKWHISKTAKLIGVERTTLYKKIKQYKIKQSSKK
ncbi:MAG: sigma 54-interacting transcriptional regulator [Candidatus Cloacimonadaceae bacterium]